MNDMEVIETSGDYRVVLEPDADCEKPMDNGDGWTASVLTYSGWDTWRSRTTYEAMYDPQGRIDAMRYFEESEWTVEPDESFKRYMAIFHGITVFTVTVVTGEVSNALAWLEPSERERVGIPAEVTDKQALDIEIGEYNRWAQGDCWGYIVQKQVTWTTDDPNFADREQWEDTDDSCWGFIGLDYAEQEAREALRRAA